MLPSVLTLLDFAASGVAVADTGAQGVMPFPFGLLDGASDVGTVETPEVVGGDDVPFGGYRRGERKRRGLERRKRLTTAERIAEMQRTYARLQGEPDAAPPVVAAVAQAVRPHVTVNSDAALPPVEAIDWRAVARDLDAIAVLLRLYQQQVDDDDAIAVLLLT